MRLEIVRNTPDYHRQDISLNYDFQLDEHDRISLVGATSNALYLSKDGQASTVCLYRYDLREGVISDAYLCEDSGISFWDVAELNSNVYLSGYYYDEYSDPFAETLGKYGVFALTEGSFSLIATGQLAGPFSTPDFFVIDGSIFFIDEVYEDSYYTYRLNKIDANGVHTIPYDRRQPIDGSTEYLDQMRVTSGGGYLAFLLSCQEEETSSIICLKDGKLEKTYSIPIETGSIFILDEFVVYECVEIVQQDTPQFMLKAKNLETDIEYYIKGFQGERLFNMRAVNDNCVFVDVEYDFDKNNNPDLESDIFPYILSIENGQLTAEKLNGVSFSEQDPYVFARKISENRFLAFNYAGEEPVDLMMRIIDLAE